MSPTGRCHASMPARTGSCVVRVAAWWCSSGSADALRDGDRVLAVVRGSAVNQDGRSNGLTAPNRRLSMAVLRAASPVPASSRATSTTSRPTAPARCWVIRSSRGAAARSSGAGVPEPSPLLIGSVKSNLGHLEAAAGIAGFIKAVLAVQRGHIPSNLHFESPNPHIHSSNLRLKVVAEHTAVAVQRPGPRRAGVSSFGFGGTNAHVVLEQAPGSDPVAVIPDPVVTTLVVSGKTSERVASTAGVLADWMAGEGAEVPLADVAHTVNHHRTRHKNVAAVCARDRAQAVAGLRALAAGDTAPGVVDPHRGAGRVRARCSCIRVRVRSGPGMGRKLLADEPAFAAAVAELEPVFVEQVGFSLREVLDTGEQVVGIDRIQPVLVGMQLALTELWRSYGVEPDAVIGHSMGEVTAAVVAGALSPADGLKVIATRSRLMSRLSGQGAMALLELDAEATEALIADYPDVTVAVFASAESNGDRRAAGAGRCGDRGGRRSGPAGASHRGRRGVAPSHD